MKWTTGDALRAREARVVGGHLDGMRIAVSRDERGEGFQYRYPDVLDMSGYYFDVDAWEFRLGAELVAS